MVRALFFLAIGTLGTTSVKAQSVVAPVSKQCTENGDASAIGSKYKKVDLVDADAVKANATMRSTNEKTGNTQIASTQVANPTVLRESAREALKTIAASPKGVSLLDEHKLNVKVGYDARPVGGILTVRVSISPTFSGVGVSTRPATSRSVSLAVDEFSQEMVDKMVSELTDEIQDEFKMMNEASAAKENAQVN